VIEFEVSSLVRGVVAVNMGWLVSSEVTSMLLRPYGELLLELLVFLMSANSYSCEGLAFEGLEVSEVVFKFLAFNRVGEVQKYGNPLRGLRTYGLRNVFNQFPNDPVGGALSC